MMTNSPIYYAEMYAVQEATPYRVASVRLPPRTAEQIHSGEASQNDLFGSDDEPGFMRLRLLNYTPARLFRDDVTLEFRLSDQNGLAVATKATSARAKLDDFFSAKKGNENG